MKLNYKRTIYVGLAFFIISLFWQTYDTIVPKILVEKFGMNQSLSGLVMALDNILALFLLPIFGHLSDKTKTRIGKRKPYIIIGTVLAALLFVTTTFTDNAQIVRLENITDNQALWDSGVIHDEGLKVEGLQFKAALERDGLTESDFVALRADDADDVKVQMFNKYVKPARTAFAWKKTVESPTTLIGFIVLLFFVLLSMSVFRSPAVALMPDVTIKSLRSKGNAVINLMGAIAGMAVLALGIVFKTGDPANTYMSYTGFFAVISVIMLVVLAVFVFKVKENKWVSEMHEDTLKYEQAEKDGLLQPLQMLESEREKQGIDEKTQNIDAVKQGIDGEKRGINAAAQGGEPAHSKPLSRPELKSLIFILASVFLWFMGFNAVTSKFSVYSGRVLNLDYNLPLMISQGVAVIAFLPIGMLSGRLGRKRTILIGVTLLSLAFGCAYFITPSSGGIMYLLFAFAGIGWAAINVNSFPMVVELASENNVGRFTGFYYAASMAAQILTPILSGLLMDIIDIKTLFPYATVFVVLSFVTMLLTRHGDHKAEPKKGIELFDVD